LERTSSSSEKLWQIEKRPIGDDDVYTFINIEEEVLYATDFNGRKYKVCKKMESLKKWKL
jgi:hypothetical protein